MAQPRARKGSSPTYLKVPPHSTEAEQAILGGILINNDALSHVMDILSPEDFYHESNRAVYEGMMELFDKGGPIDVITLGEHLNRKKGLKKVGGARYLAELVDAVSTSAGIVHHARIVRGLSVRRKLIGRCAAISESCFLDWDSTEELLEMAEQSIYNIAEEQVQGAVEPLRDVIKVSFKRVEEAGQHDDYITGVPTGFKDLNRLTGGLQPSDLVILAGRPGMGKTALALNIGYHAAGVTRKPVVLFSLEMSKHQLGIRMLGFESGINAAKLRAGLLKDREWKRLTDAADRLSGLPIYVDDSSSISVLEMKAKCRRLKKAHDLGLVIVDYLQLVQGRSSAESRQVEISEISRMLKGMAKDLDVPVLALSQLNRRVEERQNKRPELSDLRESGAIEQDADVILFICRDEVKDPESDNPVPVAEIILAKQRNGPTGTFRLTFIKELTAFKDFTERAAPF